MNRNLLPLACLLLSLQTTSIAQSQVIANAPQVNQLGYLPAGAKWGTVPAGQATDFSVVDSTTGRTVWSGRLGPAAGWAPAQAQFQMADFSALKRPGHYRLQVKGLPDSPRFVIAANAYSALNAASIKALYFNRASTALEPAHAGVYARPAGHSDERVRVHASAASTGRPEGTVISSPKGWYDAGDYNKYIVNSGISTYTLLAAYEQFPAYFKRQYLHIPESGNGIPDVLNEALWNLDWMLSMQDPEDGGVYHKLTDLGFDGMVMPHQTHGDRYVVQKSTAAALDFAAVMATASRVFKAYERQRPGLSQRMLQAARAAWGWAQAHPDAIYRQPSDVHTGEYGDSKISDEFAWAAAELYISTRDPAYYKAIQAQTLPNSVPSWGDVGGLAWMSLAQHRHQLTADADQRLIAARIQDLAQTLTNTWQSSSYRLTMQSADFNWGSNSGALNQAMMLIQGYRISGDRRQRDAAQSALDYVLGRNPLGVSMVTGFGTHSPQHPHHRPSEADSVAAPVPGFIVGGPNPGQQDKKDCPVPYASQVSALSYLDHVCSYASNEIAINWNAPLVYVTAALQSLTAPDHERPLRPRL